MSDVQNHEGTLVAVISPNEKGGTLANIEWIGRDFDATFREMEKEAAKVTTGRAKASLPVVTQALP